MAPVSLATDPGAGRGRGVRAAAGRGAHPVGAAGVGRPRHGQQPEQPDRRPVRSRSRGQGGDLPGEHRCAVGRCRGRPPLCSPSGGAGGWRCTCWSPARARWCSIRSSSHWSAGCARWWRTRSRTAPGTAFPAGTRWARSSATAQCSWSSCPPTRGRWRTVFATAVVTLIALIGISRLLLGVHYVSDVVGAWAVGVHVARPDHVRLRAEPPRRRAAGHRSGRRGARTRGPRGPRPAAPEPGHRAAGPPRAAAAGC